MDALHGLPLPDYKHPSTGYPSLLYTVVRIEREGWALPTLAFDRFA